MADIQVNSFTYRTYLEGQDPVVEVYADGVFVRKEVWSGAVFNIDSAKKNVSSIVESSGAFSERNVNFYKLIPPPPPPPTPEIVPPPAPAPPPPSPEVKKKGAWYLPKSRYRKPKSTNGGEFIIKSTGEPYTGSYIETFKKKYYAGSSPEQMGEELEKVRERGDFDLLGEAFKTLSPLLLKALKGGVVRKKPTTSEIVMGEVKRYFVQDPVTQKIVEVTKPDYVELKKQLPNRRYVEVPWNIKEPAEDMMFGNYKYEGAETQNRKTIVALEKQMPGITRVVRDFAYLIPPTRPKQVITPDTFTTTVKDPLVDLENSRKANFDTKE
jgi:hypothetical protein